MILCPQLTAIQTENAVIHLTGLFMYGDYMAGTESVGAFWTDFCRGTESFDSCTGVYRIEIICEDGRRIYFCDNSGCMRYYIHESTSNFHATLAEALPREERTPNYSAIAQFLYFGCVYDMGTLVQGVVRSDPNKYYVVADGLLSSFDKGLTPLEELEGDPDALDVQMRRLSRSAAKLPLLACTITGGTDSRAILSHMLHKGLRPTLDITGHDGQTDVDIARKIAQISELELLAVSDEPEGETWLDEAITAANGETGVCGVYRLYKKAKLLHQRGIPLECGGVAGEIYKNSFINQDFPIYWGKPRWERFVRYKVATYDFPQHLCGKSIAAQMQAVPKQVLQWVSQHTGSNKANAYLTAGYEIMQARVCSIYNMSARWYISYNPLLERNVAALAFRKNPYQLEMQAFQREQVSRFCPELRHVETDRGLTCDSARKGREFVKSMIFLLKVAQQRLFRRVRVSQRIDPCFAEGLSSPQFVDALERCRQLGIIAEDISPEQIPQGIADRLFAIGSIL